ncbi:MmcQ/YjbR family DNA-binding protein [Teredinibacter purpureus]|uniref:MmcQ/YjbR family DNA-binding protein n=1 Tax=Teredinibacter purpureus TaxID=2731756 RepID=UPI0005F8218A|nr:MmcQ/YjbR family DNA-binding protein [Teredinibacter purpureus]
MTEADVIQHALKRPEAIEDYPFGPEARVFKVRAKMFGLISYCTWQHHNGVARLNLKCDPQEALMLRDVFDAVLPGYHMNKTHWNSVMLDGSIPSAEIERMIDRSYGLIIKGLRKPERHAMEVRWGKDVLFR